MKRPLILAVAATAALLAAGAAQAADVHWSVGINLPPIGTVISNAPFYPPGRVYYPAPVRYSPPVVYQAPLYGAPPPVYEAPLVVYPAPRPYYGQRSYYERPVVVFHGRRDERWEHRGGRWDHGRWEDRDDGSGHERSHH
ncbi:MAG: hypothetical protein M3Y67_06835 [Pseudomonadota bacterium]|nr:hypothetical protein [Pseudomonadota bacterium]